MELTSAEGKSKEIELMVNTALEANYAATLGPSYEIMGWMKIPIETSNRFKGGSTNIGT